MKKEIHPKYYQKAQVVCACGNKFEVGSTQPLLKVEICSACHPLFTGKSKLIDKAGRVDKFKARVEKFATLTEKKKKREEEKGKKKKEAETLWRTRRR